MPGSEWGPRPFRFGVAAGAAMPGDVLLDAAQRVEELEREIEMVRAEVADMLQEPEWR